MRRNELFFVVAVLLLVWGCDKIENPIPEGQAVTDGIVWDDTVTVTSSATVRNFVLEEFTGFLCPNCPLGSDEIERLEGIYGHQLIPISIHAGVFAIPNPQDVNNDGTMDFVTDFRTESGDVYNNTFTFNGYPAGMVSRLSNPAVRQQWEIDIDGIKNDVPKVGISITCLYDDSTRTLQTTATTEWAATEAGEYNLQLLLLEDNIDDWQDNLGDKIEYTHKHVLRKAINSTWGTVIPSSNVGDTFELETSIVLPEEWNKDNCVVVGFVYKNEANDKEILQAEELPIVN